MGEMNRFLRQVRKADRSLLGFKKRGWDWDFKVWSPIDYQLDLVFSAEDRSFIKIFQECCKRLKDKEVCGDPSLINRFDVDSRFFNLMKTYLKKPFFIAAGDVRSKYGFHLLDFYVVRAWFERVDVGDWRIHIELKGSCVDRR